MKNSIVLSAILVALLLSGCQKEKTWYEKLQNHDWRMERTVTVQYASVDVTDEIVWSFESQIITVHFDGNIKDRYNEVRYNEPNLILNEGKPIFMVIGDIGRELAIRCHSGAIFYFKRTRKM